MIWIKYSYGDRGETAIAKTDGNLKGDGDSIKFIDMNGNQYCIFIKDLISIAPKKQWL